MFLFLFFFCPGVSSWEVNECHNMHHVLVTGSHFDGKPFSSDELSWLQIRNKRCESLLPWKANLPICMWLSGNWWRVFNLDCDGDPVITMGSAEVSVVLCRMSDVGSDQEMDLSIEQGVIQSRRFYWCTRKNSVGTWHLLSKVNCTFKTQRLARCWRCDLEWSTSRITNESGGNEPMMTLRHECVQLENH
jgi:hypothetical protein